MPDQPITLYISYHLPILQYLYQFRGDNSYHKLPDNLVKAIANQFQAQTYLFQLSQNNLVTFKTLPNINQPTWSFLTEYGIQNPSYDDFKDIEARIEPNGIKAVEEYNGTITQK